MKSFNNFLNENKISSYSKEEILTQLQKNALTPYYIHFSDSDTFPPVERKGSSAYSNPEGGKVGASVYLPKVGLFLWRVKEFKDKLIKIFSNDLMTAGVYGLFSQRKFCYFTKISSSAEILTFSKYTQTDLERDLKKLNFDFLWSKTNISDYFLEAFEFGHPQLINPVDIKSSLSLPQMLDILFKQKKLNLTDFTEKRIPGDPKKRLLRLVSPLIYYNVLILLARYYRVIDPETIVYTSEKIPEKNNDKTEYRSILDFYGLVQTWPFPKVEYFIDIKATTEKIRTLLDLKTIQTDHLFKITPDQYIEAFSSFVKKHARLNQEIKDHPALRIWLTVLFFSAANGSSWKALWNEVLGYDVLVDDDETLKVIPGIEKVVIARPQIGVEETMLSRLDNEGTQVIVLDNTVLSDIIQVKL